MKTLQHNEVEFDRTIASLKAYGFVPQQWLWQDPYEPHVLLKWEREDARPMAVLVNCVGNVTNFNKEEEFFTDFATWQMHNQSELLGWDDEDSFAWQMQEKPESLWDDEAPNLETTTIPCDCGSPNAVWRGDKWGLRMYICDECAKNFPELNQ